MLHRLHENKTMYDEEELADMTRQLFENIDEGIDKLIREAFDPSIIDNIDVLPAKEVPGLIKNLVGDIYQRKSPFAPIQAIALYFSKDGAIGHSTGAKPIINHLMKDSGVSHSVWVIQQTIKKIEVILQQKGLGYQMIYDIDYCVDDIIKAVQTLIAALNKNYQLDWFRGTEAIDGSKDGRRKGLASILLNASSSLQSLKEFFTKMKKFAKQGRDAMSYNTNYIR